MSSKIKAFEMWFYRRILKVRYTDRMINVAVLNRMQMELKFLKNMMKRKIYYAGHVAM
jgi:hypothetical protein